MSDLRRNDNIELTRELWEEILDEFQNGVDFRISRRFDYVMERILEQLILNRGSLQIEIQKHPTQEHSKISDQPEDQPRLF